MVSTHIYGVAKEIDRKMFIFQVRHVTDQIDHLRKTNLVLMVTKHISGISKQIDGKTFIFQLNLVLWPLKSIILENEALLWWLQYIFLVVSNEIDGKTFIFQTKPSHVTPQINRLGKTSPVLRVPTHIYDD